jgi:hypothetical protein
MGTPYSVEAVSRELAVGVGGADQGQMCECLGGLTPPAVLFLVFVGRRIARLLRPIRTPPPGRRPRPTESSATGAFGTQIR